MSFATSFPKSFVEKQNNRVLFYTHKTYTAPQALALVAGIGVVEALIRGRLAPLLIRGLLTTSVTSRTWRSSIAHGLSSIAGRRLSRRSAISLLLTSILTYECQSCTRNDVVGIKVRLTSVLGEKRGRCSWVRRRLSTLRAKWWLL